jgi:hypothetical protein
MLPSATLRTLDTWLRQDPQRSGQLWRDAQGGDAQALSTIATEAGVDRAALSSSLAAQPTTPPPRGLGLGGAFAPTPSSLLGGMRPSALPPHVGAPQGGSFRPLHAVAARTWSPPAVDHPVPGTALLPFLQALRGPAEVTPAQRAAGFRANTVELTLGGNNHFPGWQHVVPRDTSLVVVQGEAYKGCSVQVGGDRFDNAALVYVKRQAGVRETVGVDVVGKPGTEVRLYYLRVDERAQFDVDGNSVRVQPRGKYQGIAGEAFWRDAFVAIHDTAGLASEAKNAALRYHRHDTYGWGVPGYATGENRLGGEATDADAQAGTTIPTNEWHAPSDHVPNQGSTPFLR